MPLGGQAITAGLGIAEGIGQTISSIGKLKKDKEELAKLKQPFYKIQDEYYKNNQLAEGMAQGGTPQATKDYETSETERGQSSSIAALLQAGGNPADISKIFDVYNRGVSRNASEDAQNHMKNIEYYMSTNKDLAGQKNIQWSLNEDQPYQRKLKEITERRAADEKGIWGGINTAIGSASAGFTSMSNEKLNQSQIGVNNTKASFMSSLFGNTDPHSSNSFNLDGD